MKLISNNYYIQIKPYFHLIILKLYSLHKRNLLRKIEVKEA